MGWRSLEERGARRESGRAGKIATWWMACIQSGGPPKGWAGVRGPIRAAWCEVRRLGWKWVNPLLLRTADGVNISLLACSATAVARRLREAVVQQLAVEMARAAWANEAEGRVAYEVVLAHLGSNRVDPRHKCIARALA